ncbi:unnamed protein product [Peniophora sp. CBMAI 1063]|nr:unnamed protein product [Peniophora sp. CBMAI 1063]
MTNLNTDDLRGLSRRELQHLAKSHSLKANGSSTQIIEALCDRFPDGVPQSKRGLSPTTAISRGRSAPSRRAKAASPVYHQSVNQEPHSPARHAPRFLDKADPERLSASNGSRLPPLPEPQVLRPEDAVVLENTEEILRQMMKELQEAREASKRLESENAALRVQLAPPVSTNALQLGDEGEAGPSSSQATEYVSVSADSTATAAGQPMTPTSLQQSQVPLPNVTAPSSAPVGNGQASSSQPTSAHPRRPPSPVGLSRISRINEELDNLRICRQTSVTILTYALAQVAMEQAEISGRPSKELEERLKNAEKDMEVEIPRRFNLDRYQRLAKNEHEEAALEKFRKLHTYGELIWNVGEKVLETYPHKPPPRTDEERANYVRFRDRAVRKDEPTLTLFHVDPNPDIYRVVEEDLGDEDYLPPSYDDPEYDATSDATPSELDDVEMQDIDMSVEDDLVLGVEGQGIDAHLSDLAVTMRGAPPKHTLEPTRANIPDVQGYIHLPQGRRTRACWIPVREKERVWVRCDQEVCTHGMSEPTDPKGKKPQTQVPCYFFDDLPEIAGRPKPKGRWVERDVDLLEGGKYTADCIKDMSDSRDGLYGAPWPVVPGWKQRLERVPTWEHN